MADIKSYLELFAPFYGVGTLFSCLGFLAGALVAHKLDLGRSRILKYESDIASERVVFVPLLKHAISDCGGVGQAIAEPWYSWQQHIAGVEKCADRFSVILKGRRKRAFDAAWQICRDTKNMELLNKDGGCFLDGQEAELKAAQKLITSRLQAVLDCVEQA